MKLGSIPNDIPGNAAPAPVGLFFPVQEEDVCRTPPLATNTSSSRLRNNKRVAYEEFERSDIDDEEESVSDGEVCSPPQLIRNNVPYRKIAVSNSSLRMQIRRLTEKLTEAKGDLEEANQQHGNSAQIILRLKEEVASANIKVEALVDVGA
jgi:hypothetical protein